jgi:NitT/TauT family transport system permease protein
MPAWLKKLLIVGLWLLTWHLAALAVGNDILLASPAQTAQALAASLGTAAFWVATLRSMLRIGLGFASACLSALGLGVLAWRLPLLRDVLSPAVAFVKSVPVVCFIVMVLIWFGARWVAMVAVLLVAFPAFYFAVLEGLAQRDEQLAEMLKVFHVTGAAKMASYHWPAVLPFIQAAAKTTVGMSWKSGVAAELIGLPLGSIGTAIYSAKILLNSADVFAWTLVVIALSILSEQAFLLLLTHSGRWSWSAALPKWPTLATTSPAPTDIEGRGLFKQYGDKAVLSGIGFHLAAGGRYSLGSPSGSGKTTLLRLLAGLDKPDAGSLANPNSVSMVFQEARLFEQHSAMENIRLTCGRYASVAEIRSTLSCLLPADSLDVPVGSLSGGMRRRVELCRALLLPSQLLLLDEPFSGLDAANSAMAQELTLSMLAGRTLVIVSHDLDDIEPLGVVSLI